jgi:chromosome partitioning protein
VNHLVLSGTPSIVPSGTRSTCYRGPKSGETYCLSTACRASNFSNLDSFGIYLTNFAFSRVGEKTRSAAAECVVIVALLNQNGGVDKTTVTLDPVGGWPRQPLRVVVIDSGRKGENENCWLDWLEQRANKGLTRLFEVIGLAPGAHRDSLEIACMVGHVVTDGPPRFAGRTRTALLATDVALTPFQSSPSGEGESVEIRKLLEKAWIFRPGLCPRFILNRCGPRALIVREKAEALAVSDPPTPCSRAAGRTAFANAARSGQLLSEANKDGHATRPDDRTRCGSREQRA